jgi:hypothetical protein
VSRAECTRRVQVAGSSSRRQTRRPLTSDLEPGGIKPSNSTSSAAEVDDQWTCRPNETNGTGKEEAMGERRTACAGQAVNTNATMDEQPGRSTAHSLADCAMCR